MPPATRQDDNRPGSHEHESFVFLGYEFRARSVRNSKSGVMFTAFTPAISPEALKKISGEVRSWRIHTHTRHSLQQLADQINPVVRGWMTYYGRFTPAALMPLLKRINGYLVRWARKKYRRLAPFKRAKRWWDGLLARNRADAVLDAVLHCGLLHPPPPDQIDEELSDERLH